MAGPAMLFQPGSRGPSRTSGAGMTLQSCSKLRQGGQEFFCLHKPSMGKNGLLLEAGIILGEMVPK